jgi:hypothetical protein
MLSLRSIFSRPNKSFSGDKMLRKLSMTGGFLMLFLNQLRQRQLRRKAQEVRK